MTDSQKFKKCTETVIPDGTNAHQELADRLSSSISIVECGEESAAAWDSFVKKVSGTYCHLFGWKRVFERSYALQTIYLAFCQDDSWLGILPVSVMPRLPGMAPKALSLPYCNYGGMLTAPGVSPEPLKKLALKYLSDKGVNRVEFREITKNSSVGGEVTMVLKLPSNSELLWNQVGCKVRNQIRKAQRSRLTLCWGANQVDDLYAVYARNMGRLGTPVHSPDFVRATIDCLSDYADILTVRYEGRPVGGMLVIKYGNTWVDPIASCLSDFNKLNPNMLLYWGALSAACEAGAKSFDFGRSHRDSGTYRFKRQWGPEEISLNYHSYQNGIFNSSATTTFYRNRSASMLAGVWRHLPAFVQDRFGPIVRRWLP